MGEKRRATAPVCPAYKWLYGFGFVRPQTGETYWLLMPTVSVEVMNLALAEFARDVNPEAKKQIVLLVDRAGFHTSKAVQVPAGIELFYLPPYSPELQPAERLWPLLREVIANRVLKTLSSLEKVLVNRCQWQKTGTCSHMSGFNGFVKSKNNMNQVNLVLAVRYVFTSPSQDDFFAIIYS